jgi:O-antigen/teichoic acid export membrane protein
MSSLSGKHKSPLDKATANFREKRGRLLIRNTLASAASATFAQILAIITFPFLIRQVGPTDYGIFNLASAAVGYFAIVNLAARVSVVKYTAELNERDPESISGFFTNAILINFLLGILIAIVLFFLALYCENIFTISEADVPRAKQILFINAGAVFLTQPLTLFGSILYGFQKYGVVSLLDTLWTFARNAIILAMYFFDGSIFWLVWEEIIMQLFKFTILWLIVRIKYPFVYIDFNSLNRQEIKKIFSYGGWSVVYIFAMTIVYQGSMMLTGIFISIGAIVYLQIAYNLYNLVNTVSNYMNSAVVPSSSSAIAESDNAFIHSLIVSGPKINLSIILPITVTIFVFSPGIINFWVGQEYLDPTINVSRILISSWFLLAPAAFLTQIYFGQKNISQLSLVAFLGACSHFALVIILSRYFNLAGVALACSIFYGLLSIASFVIISRKFQLSWKLFFTRVVFPGYAINLTFGALLWVTAFFVGNANSLVKLLIYFIIAVAIGISLNIFFYIRKEFLTALSHFISDLTLLLSKVTQKNKRTNPSIL